MQNVVQMKLLIVYFILNLIAINYERQILKYIIHVRIMFQLPFLFFRKISYCKLKIKTSVPVEVKNSQNFTGNEQKSSNNKDLQ